ncbi:hypothetical protein CN918_29395 [Priestia megaterium]|nr:hypothetical protein CN918_29395 [Priestia megaterium]
MKLQGLQIRIGRILNKAGYKKSVLHRYSYARGYRFDRANYIDKSTTYLTWEDGDRLTSKTDAQMIKSIYSRLSSNGLAKYLQPLNEGDEVIRFQNVEY